MREPTLARLRREFLAAAGVIVAITIGAAVVHCFCKLPNTGQTNKRPQPKPGPVRGLKNHAGERGSLTTSAMRRSPVEVCG